ncbi:transaldolase family protein [Zhaonella formicivorans]|uniref:transaldolase family protein n=1 Tax=Zhaonella formicivorans TaxID=2528593 RepID=UPI0010E471B8|nr:transaldolase family protein [Zhaonella formicivorans]
MMYLLDTANIEQLRKCYDLFPVSGVTTNPSIISREKSNLKELFTDIRNIIGPESMLHVQVMGTSSEEMVREAKYLSSQITGNLYIKIPAVPQGIKAIKELTKLNMKTTATAIFTPQQALMAAAAGASFVAPYVNRLDNICGDGVEVLGEIMKFCKLYQLGTKVLAASFKNVEQVHKAALCGVHAVTVSAELMEQLLEHPLTWASVNSFKTDWEEVYGAGKLLTDVFNF